MTLKHKIGYILLAILVAFICISEVVSGQEPAFTSFVIAMGILLLFTWLLKD